MANWKAILVSPDDVTVYDLDALGTGGVVIDHVADFIIKQTTNPPLPNPPAPPKDPVPDREE